MSELNRIVAFTPKGNNISFPSVACNWQSSIQLDGITTLGLRFWKRFLFRKSESAELNEKSLDQVAGFYFIKAKLEAIEPRNLRYAYWCLYVNDNLPNFCLTLLQLDIKAEAHLVVINGRKPLASFVVASSVPIQHILEQHFPSVKKIPRLLYRYVRDGHLYHPRVLARFSLPKLPGIDDAAPVSIPMPNPSVATGRVSLGDALSPITGAPVCSLTVSTSEINRGTLVVGATGSGKTNTVMRLVDQLRDKTSILVFDVKGEYRSLHKTLNAAVYGFREKNLLSTNLLKAEGSPSEWIKQFSSIFAEVISKNIPASGSKDVIAEELDRLYGENGVYEGSENWPHIGDLLEALDARSQRTQSDREKNWLASALRVMRTISIGRTKDAFHVRQGLSTRRFLSGVTVVDLEGLGDADGVSLVMSVMLQRIRNALANDPIRDELRHVVVVEEAQNILASGREASSVIATTCREIRAFGVGLVYVTQMPSEFSKNALSNVSTIIAHRLSHPDDRRVIGQMMGVDAKLFEGLEPGFAVVKNSQVALLKVPLVERPFVPERDLPAPVVTREEVSSEFGRRKAVEAKVRALAPREWQVFKAIAESRAIYPKELRELLGYSQGEVNEALGRTIRLGLVGYRHGKVQGAPGNARSIYFLMPDGEEAYRGQEGRYADRRLEASPVHADLVGRVVAALRISRKPHQRFDILFDEGFVERAIEVESGSNNNAQLLENLAKSLEFQGEARFVAADENTANRVLQIASRWCYDERKPLTMKIALIDALPAWKTFHFQPDRPNATRASPARRPEGPAPDPSSTAP